MLFVFFKNIYKKKIYKNIYNIILKKKIITQNIILNGHVFFEAASAF